MPEFRILGTKPIIQVLPVADQRFIASGINPPNGSHNVTIPYPWIRLAKKSNEGIGAAFSLVSYNFHNTYLFLGDTPANRAGSRELETRKWRACLFPKGYFIHTLPTKDRLDRQG